MPSRDRDDSLSLSQDKGPREQRDREVIDTLVSILECDSFGVAYLDAGSTYRVFNGGAERLTGYAREEILGEAVPRTLFSPEDRETIERAMERRGELRNLETCIKRRDGSFMDVVLNMSTQLNRDGSVKGYLQFLLDNTQKKHLQSLLLHSQKMEIVGEMAGGIAHDFNNLLGGILGYATFMMDMLGENHELRSYLEIIERSVKRASDLTERLLTFSRDTGKEETAVNCNVLLREVIKLLERTIDKRIVIELNLEKRLWAVRGAAGQLEQAFLNVCLNARDAMPQGGKLLISSENAVIDETYPRLSWNMKPGSYVMVSISDTGVGMDGETVERIFEPFFTTKKRGEGTWLGLSMVYGIIDKHGGFAKVYSEIGKGTVFNIYLPADIAGAPERQEAAHRRYVPFGKEEEVLVIDDEPIVRDLAREMLRKLGYRPVTAGGAAAARSQPQGRPFRVMRQRTRCLVQRQRER